MSTNLSSCPFCGEHLVKVETSYKKIWVGECKFFTYNHPDNGCILNQCGRTGVDFYLRDDPKEIELWNKRI